METISWKIHNKFSNWNLFCYCRSEFLRMLYGFAALNVPYFVLEQHKLLAADDAIEKN